MTTAPLASAGTWEVRYSVTRFDAPVGSTSMVVSADLDQDGYSEVLLADGVFPPVPLRNTVGDILRGGPDGFQFEPGTFTGSVHPREFAFADFNADGTLDFFIAAHGYDAPPFPGEPDLLMLSGAHGYTEVVADLTLASGFTHSAVAADIDDDGDQDVLAVTLGDGAYILRNDGTGNFAVTTEGLPSAYVGRGNGVDQATATALHDVDGDGFLDLILGTQGLNGDPSDIYFGTGDGQFPDAEHITLPDNPLIDGNQIVSDIAFIDIDLDGDDDIILSSTQNNPFYVGAGLQVLRNDGNRVFVDISEAALGERVFQVESSWHLFLTPMDFNGDGIEDFFTTGNDSVDEAVVYLGNGAGGFTPLYGTDILGESGLDFLIYHFIPTLNAGRIDIAAPQYFEGELIVSQVRTTQNAVVEGMSFEGDQIFSETMGNSALNGGPGFDIFVYDGMRADYTIDQSENASFVVSRPGVQVDVLSDVEKLVFDDAALLMGIKSGVADYTYALYQAAFARRPDEAGFLFWEGVMTSGFYGEGEAAELGLSRAFTGSEEFRSLFTSDTTEDYLTSLYANVLGRTPDAEGLAFWEFHMNESGLSQAEVLRYFTLSKENIQNIAPFIDDGYWVI
jgi:hypothetical protein